jgi:branched-chain amino acid transport system ATP-binding protein
MLEIHHLSKHFGGVHANRDISLQLKSQQIHALIGPNGAGKSTLIAQIAGELIPDYGQVIFKDQNISKLKPEQRNRLGLGRLFQTTALFSELSVLDNIRIPLLRDDTRASGPGSWFWKPLAKDSEIRTTAIEMLTRLGMEHHLNQRVGTLSHGEQRQLEMVMTLATRPDCLLLDEPMAGMSSEESIRMINLIRRLKQDHAILLVEHDMHAVFDLADTISVLVEGRVIACGDAGSIRNNTDVQAAYLGADSC